MIYCWINFLIEFICCRFEILEMDPLFKTALRRTLFFLLWTFLSAWLFSAVEYTQKDDSEEKHQLLLSLYDSMASKYNMTIEEFNNFSNHAHQALSEPKPRWTYPASVNFVFQALTTIGKNKHEIQLNPDNSNFQGKSKKVRDIGSSSF